MSGDLPERVRAAYEHTVRRLRSDTAAYEEAVRIVLNHTPRLDRDGARRAVAMILSGAVADAE